MGRRFILNLFLLNMNFCVFFISFCFFAAESMSKRQIALRNIVNCYLLLFLIAINYLITTVIKFFSNDYFVLALYTNFDFT